MLISPNFNHKVSILEDVHMYHVLASYLHDSPALCFCSGIVEIGPQHDTTTPSKDDYQTSGMPCRKGSVSLQRCLFHLAYEKKKKKKKQTVRSVNGARSSRICQMQSRATPERHSHVKGTRLPPPAPSLLMQGKLDAVSSGIFLLG